MRKLIIVITITLPLDTPPVPPVPAVKKQRSDQQETQPVCRCIIRHENAA